ncbi:hypothetical protein KFE25_005494 [Diacronema lutheri]|uniref:GH16 domain-containing protein n=1 Tax=Diacronema lutheri TaxID=2081491 RepID=A0A8J6CAV9_DIALT|nr:hypothetical protein KFE25_005494 [Diacronema lutheri]
MDVRVAPFEQARGGSIPPNARRASLSCCARLRLVACALPTFAACAITCAAIALPVPVCKAADASDTDAPVAGCIADVRVLGEPGTLVWADEFASAEPDGRPNASHWRYETGDTGWGNDELQFYTDRAENAAVADGELTITARCEAYGPRDFTSARLTTAGTFSWASDHRLDVRAWLPTGVGAWPTIRMLPTESAYGAWPLSGEIGVVELVGCDPELALAAAVTEELNAAARTRVTNSSELQPGWHNFSLVWREDSLQWFFDEQWVLEHRKRDGDGPSRWPFDRRFHLVMSVAVDGARGGYCIDEPPSCSDPAELGRPQRLRVDYVRVSTRRDGCAPPRAAAEDTQPRQAPAVCEEWAGALRVTTFAQRAGPRAAKVAAEAIAAFWRLVRVADRSLSARAALGTGAAIGALVAVIACACACGAWPSRTVAPRATRHVRSPAAAMPLQRERAPSTGGMQVVRIAAAKTAEGRPPGSPTPSLELRAMSDSDETSSAGTAHAP